jgi:RNA polymerase sigma-70 factor (ECF subfamily)
LRQVESLEVLDNEERYFTPSPHGTLDHGQRLEMLQRALAELSPLCRESFLLRKIEGLSHPEIAQQLGISKALVEKHIVNAMKHCRLRIKQWDAH